MTARICPPEPQDHDTPPAGILYSLTRIRMRSNTMTSTASRLLSPRIQAT
jgi:hypothetical protein